MKFCDPHIARMRAVCCDLGLEARISRDAAHLTERLAKRNPYDIDPLHHALLSLRMLANRVVAHNHLNPELIGCPICLFHEEALRAGWIDNVAKALDAFVKRKDAEKLADIERTRIAEEDYRSL